MRGVPVPRETDVDTTKMDTFVEPTDWSTVPEPYDDPSQDPDVDPVDDK